LEDFLNARYVLELVDSLTQWSEGSDAGEEAVWFCVVVDGHTGTGHHFSKGRNVLVSGEGPERGLVQVDDAFGGENVAWKMSKSEHSCQQERGTRDLHPLTIAAKSNMPSGMRVDWNTKASKVPIAASPSAVVKLVVESILLIPWMALIR
jgi:hypothetical protein